MDVRKAGWSVTATLLLLCLGGAARADENPWQAFRESMPATDSPLLQSARPHLSRAVAHRAPDGRSGYLETTVRMGDDRAVLRYYPQLSIGGTVVQRELLTLSTQTAGGSPVPIIKDGDNMVLLLPGAMQKAITLASTADGTTAAIGADVAVPLTTMTAMRGRLGSAASGLPPLPSAGPAPGEAGWTPPAELEMTSSGRGYRLNGNTLYYVRADGRSVEVGHLSPLSVRGSRDTFRVLAVNTGNGQVAYTLGGQRIGPWTGQVDRHSMDIWFRPVEGGRSVPLLPLAYNRHGSVSSAIDAEGQRYELRFPDGRNGVYAPVGPAPVPPPATEEAPGSGERAPSGPVSINLSGVGGFQLDGNRLMSSSSDGRQQVGQVVNINVGGNFGRRRVILYQPPDAPREEWGYYAYGSGGELTRLGGVGELGTGNVWSRPVVDEGGNRAGSRALIPVLGSNYDARGNWASTERRYVDLEGNPYTLDLSGRIGVFRPGPRPVRRTTPPAVVTPPVVTPNSDSLPTVPVPPPVVVTPPTSSTENQPPTVEATSAVRERVDAALATLAAAHDAPADQRAARIAAARSAIERLGAEDKPYLASELGRLLHASAQSGSTLPWALSLDHAELYVGLDWSTRVMPDELRSYRERASAHMISLFARLPPSRRIDRDSEQPYSRLSTVIGRMGMNAIPALEARIAAIPRGTRVEENFWLHVAKGRAEGVNTDNGRNAQRRDNAVALVTLLQSARSDESFNNWHEKAMEALAAIHALGSAANTPVVVTYLESLLTDSRSMRWALGERRRAAIAALQRIGVPNARIAQMAVPQLLLDASHAGPDGNTYPQGRRDAINYLDSLPVADEADRNRRIAALRAIKDGDPEPANRRAAEDAMNALIRGRPAPATPVPAPVPAPATADNVLTRYSITGLYFSVDTSGDLRDPLSYTDGVHTNRWLASLASRFSGLVSDKSVTAADVPALWARFISDLPNPSDQGDAAIRAFAARRVYDLLDADLRRHIGTRP